MTTIYNRKVLLLYSKETYMRKQSIIFKHYGQQF